MLQDMKISSFGSGKNDQHNGNGFVGTCNIFAMPDKHSHQRPPRFLHICNINFLFLNKPKRLRKWCSFFSFTNDKHDGICFAVIYNLILLTENFVFVFHDNRRQSVTIVGRGYVMPIHKNAQIPWSLMYKHTSFSGGNFLKLGWGATSICNM